MKIIEKIVDVTSGKETFVERTLSNAEIQHQKKLEEFDNKIANEQAAKWSQKAEILDRLGITEEEAKLLLS